MSIELTKEQEKHKESIMWLLEGPRMSGRSFLLAHCYIEMAIHHPQDYIHVRELNGTKESDYCLMRHVQRVISLMPKDVASSFTLKVDSIVFKP